MKLNLDDDDPDGGVGGGAAGGVEGGAAGLILAVKLCFLGTGPGRRDMQKYSIARDIYIWN